MVDLLEHPGVERVLRTGELFPERVWEGPDEDAAFLERREAELFRQQVAAGTVSPCEGCWREEWCDQGCESWRSYYLRRQRRINAYGKAAYRQEAAGRENVFTYSHPDMVRRYLKTHPCRGCALEKGCDIPCGRYLHWYDSRMAWIRQKRSGIGKEEAGAGLIVGRRSERLRVPPES